MRSSLPVGVRTSLCQVKTCSAVMVMALAQGMAIGWASPALEKFSDNQAPFSVTTNQSSWIVSLYDLGMMVGAWLCALVFTRAGRRQTILVGPTMLLLWVLLTFFASSPAFVMAARLLGGAGQGIVMSFCFIYIAEAASAGLRGVLILATSMLLPAGELVAYLYGPYVSYRWQAAAPLPVILLAYLLVFFWMEETPFYLAKAGRGEEMVRVLGRLRQGLLQEDINREAESIRSAVEKQLQEAKTWKEVFSRPEIKYSSFLVFIISGSFALAGVSTVLSYTTQIFSASGAPIDKNVSSILVMTINVAMVIVAMFAIERLGRRLQLTLASIGNAIAMGGMCAFMITKQVYGVDTSGVSWIPLVLMMIYISCTGVGVNTVPQILMSELLGQQAKATLAPAVMTFVSLTSFLCTKFFLPVGNDVGYYVPFAVFAVVNLFIAIFTLLLVPETKGKTLVEVQEILRNKRLSKEPL